MKEILVALVSGTKRLPRRELFSVAAAVQKQLKNDFGPAWNITASIKAFPNAKQVPKDFWPVTVRDRLDQPGMWSYHWVANGRPFAEVTYNERWSIGVSHDVMEMLADPYVNRRQRAPSIVRGKKHGVDYLVQVCDPCADPKHAYEIDGVRVADFSLPAYWNIEAAKASKYSFTGALTEPFQVLSGGYLTWLDPKTNHWWQKVWWDRKSEYRDLGVAEATVEEETTVEIGGEVRSVKRLSIRLQNPLLRDFYLTQMPLIESIRDSIEKLIREFGHAAAGRKTWTELRPRNLDDLYLILNGLSENQAYVFRGHSSAAWPNLVPSLHRTLGTDRSFEQKVFVEATAIRTFRRHARSLLQPSELSYFDLILDGITLMQHYGAPTRLLDWTLSPWVACYFATQGDDATDAAVWTFNHDELLKNNHQRRDSRDVHRFRKLAAAETVEDWAMAALYPGNHIEVFRYQYANPQMGAQQSLFTISGRLGENHDVALERSLPEPWQTLKIIIAKEDRNRLRQRLSTMNVSPLALFPTLDGVGRNIRESIQWNLALRDEGLLWMLDDKERERRRRRATAHPGAKSARVDSRRRFQASD